MQEKMHHKWLTFSKTDLDAAQDLLNLNQQYSGMAAYHAQQSMEKSLKAFLLYKNQEILKIHNLNILLNQCMVFNAEFIRFRQHAEYLNPFSIITRYPDDQCTELTPQDAQQLINLSKECYLFVHKNLFYKTIRT